MSVYTDNLTSSTSPAGRFDETKRLVFHTDRGSTYTANALIALCRTLGVRQIDGPGRVVLQQRRRRSVPRPAWNGKS